MRDPRLNPIAGDVTRNRDGVEFHVRDSDQHTVTYQEYGSGELLTCEVDEWLQWAEFDEIVTQASDAAAQRRGEGSDRLDGDS